MEKAAKTILSKAIEKIKGLIESDYEEGIIGAKAMDVGLRLTAQFCVRGLLASGMTKTEIAKQIKVANNSPGFWLTARKTPNLNHLIPLVALYRKVCVKDYRKASLTEALVK